MILGAIYGDQADRLQRLLEDIDVNAPLVSNFHNCTLQCYIIGLIQA